MDREMLEGLSDAEQIAAINDFQVFGTAVVLIEANGDKRYIPLSDLWPTMQKGDTLSMRVKQKYD